MHTASESTARKLKWLPREQWQRPYAEQQSNPDLSGRSPFTGMFSGERPALRLMFTAGLVRRDYADKMAALWSLQLRYHHLTLAHDFSWDTNHHRNDAIRRADSAPLITSLPCYRFLSLSLPPAHHCRRHAGR